ncbi:MAG: C-GCAxxG-C-C family protein, partial [Bacteroidales bacterium]
RETNDRAALALEAFNNKYNCAQSVLMAWPELIAPDRSLALRQACGFGGGMGRLQGTCGTVTGSYMVIGLSIGAELPDDLIKDEIAALVREFTERFLELNPSTICRDLTGVDLNTGEGREAAKQPAIKVNVCSKCVADAVSILEDILVL